MATQPIPSLRRVYITAAACTFFAGAYAALGIAPPPLVFLVAYYATPVSVVLWLQRDARLRGMATIQDWGMLTFITWPVAVPWYAIKTRGVGAGLPLAAFLMFPALVPPLTFALVTIARRR
ncbi:MAG TPA: hypothetical protein VGV12_15700 [Gemmatimonadales bacterium]|nr:hypothetical protein [Gemmatimonadales bacterium]